MHGIDTGIDELDSLPFVIGALLSIPMDVYTASAMGLYLGLEMATSPEMGLAVTLTGPTLADVEALVMSDVGLGIVAYADLAEFNDALQNDPEFVHEDDQLSFNVHRSAQTSSTFKVRVKRGSLAPAPPASVYIQLFIKFLHLSLGNDIYRVVLFSEEVD